MEQRFEEVDNYISGLLAPEDAALTETLRSIDELGMFNASVSPNQGKFLQVLAMAANAKNILEFGTMAGYSTIWLARILPEGGKVVTMEFDEQLAEVARKNIDRAGLTHKVDIHTGKALDLLPQIEAAQTAPFDMIFIDADKPPYTEYFQWAIRLGRPGTIIVADNVIRNGNVLDTKSTDEKVLGVQRLNEWLSGCENVTATILQNVGVKEYDGMVVAVINH